jgi:hypothetical protein
MRASLILLVLLTGCELLPGRDKPLAPLDDTGGQDIDGDGFSHDLDCDEDDPLIHPGADEICDGVDNDCDGLVDPPTSIDASTWYDDADGDGYGDPASGTLACYAAGSQVSDATDCDDGNASVNPGALEYCNGRDDDCDGDTDPSSSVDASAWYNDADADGYGDEATEQVSCSAESEQVNQAGDCDDGDPAVHPAADEVCNGIDDDCDGATDPSSSLDAPTWYTDADADGYGDDSSAQQGCSAPSGTTGAAGDCDDGDPAVHPAAEEVCNGVDDDCDGEADPDSSVDAATWFTDADGDGFGDASTAAVSCDAASDQVSDATDCDDGDDSVHPAADELCNGVDDDCDGSVDPATSVDAITWYTDADADGFGDPATASASCVAASDQVNDASDCDDGDAAVNPAATETCNGVDDDCDGSVDPATSVDASTWYTDADGDGYGQDSTATVACSGGSGAASQGGDCDDGDAAVSPGAIEWCGDGVDADCDGLDEGDDDCAPTGTSDDPDAWIAGTVGAVLGSAITVMDDCTGDAHAELVMGSPTSGSAAEGKAWLFTAFPTDSYSRGTWDVDHVFYGDATDDLFATALAGMPDMDGDGVVELAVGGPGHDGGGAEAGAVWLFPGPDASDSASTCSDASVELYGEASGDQAGSMVADGGDLDGDGVRDLLIAAPGHDGQASNAGAIYVAFGGGLGSGTLEAGVQARFDGERGGDALAVAAGLGDLNGDGYDDLGIGAAAADHNGADSGSVWIHLGPIRPTRYEVGSSTTRIDGGSAGDAAGAAVAVGDSDADGHVDLWIGATGTDDGGSGAGSASLLRGPLPIGALNLDEADAHITGSDRSDAAGGWLATGDFDGDGWSDLSMAVPGAELLGSGQGGVFLFYGPTTASSLALDDADASLHAGSGNTAGQGLATFDIDQDGFDDLAYHVFTSHSERIDLHLGGPRLPDTAPAPDSATDDDGDGYSEDDGDCDDGDAGRSPGLSEICGDSRDEDCDGYADRCGPAATVAEADLDLIVPYDLSGAYSDFGSAIRLVGDLNGDGAEDFAVQDESWDSDRGRVIVFFGPLPPGSIDAGDADVEIQGNYPGDVSGTVLASAGDLDDDGFDDLFVGSPYGSYLGIEDGFVTIFRGGPQLRGSHHIASADWLIHGTHDERHAGYGGGATDLNGDGHDDLFIAGGTDTRETTDNAVVVYGPLGTGTHALDDVADLIIDGGSAGGHYTAWDLRAAGDVNGDGYDDLLVYPGNGGSCSSLSVAGTSLLLFEGPLPSGGVIDGWDANALINPTPGSSLVSWVLCDLNGDALSELVILSGEQEWSVLELSAMQGPVEVLENEVATVRDSRGKLDLFHHDLACGDINRDGVDDLVLGSTLSYSDDGLARVFYGPLEGELLTTDADVTIEGIDDHYTGERLAVLDLNSDGFDDLLLGMKDYGSSSRDGAFGVLYGGWTSATALPAEPLDPDADADADGYSASDGDCHDGDADIFPGSTEICGDGHDEDCDGTSLECSPVGERTEHSPHLFIDGYHRSMARFIRSLGDLDGDGLPETMVVDDYYALGVMQSPLYPAGCLTPADFSMGSFTSAGYGWYTISDAPDVDGDGIPEITINGAGPSGTLTLLDSSGGLGARDLSTAAWIFYEDSASSTLGTYHDGGPPAFAGTEAAIVVSATSSLAGADSGAVYLFGVSDAERGTFTGADADLIITGEGPGEYLGADVHVLGDLDGDGLSELGFSTNHGGSTCDEIACVWRSDGPGGTVSAADMPVRMTDTSSYTWMVSYSPGDLDGDGLRDLAFAYKSHDSATASRAGCVYLWSGMPADGDYTPPIADLTITGSEAGAYLGAGVAEDLDFDRDGAVDLVVGSSAEGTVDSEGAVYLWYGELTLAGAMAADSDADGIIHGDEGWEELGYGLIAAGDVDGDGFDDLWAGVSGAMAVLLRGGPRE